MKKCPICRRQFPGNDEYCPADGAMLYYDAGTGDQPTIVTQRGGLPITANSSAAMSPLVYVAFTALDLVPVAALIFAVRPAALFGDSSSDEDKNVAVKQGEDERARIEREKGHLEAKEENLRRERERLDAEKRAVEQRRVVPPQPASNSYSNAVVHRPTSNIRTSPGGGVLCKITTVQQIRVYGSSGVSDHNGTWYHTGACGTMGVIHSTQFKYL